MFCVDVGLTNDRLTLITTIDFAITIVTEGLGKEYNFVGRKKHNLHLRFYYKFSKSTGNIFFGA